MAHKLDIFSTLDAIDDHDLDFLSQQDETARKGFAPSVVLRWASAVTGPDAEWYLVAINERANLQMWNLGDHPDFQYRLIASCGVGRPQRHQWIDMPKRQRGTDLLRKLLLHRWPAANDMELDILLGQMDRDACAELARSLGYTQAEEKDIVTAYDRHTGQEASKPKAKKARRA